MYQIKFKLSSAHSPEDFGYLTVVKKSSTNSPRFSVSIETNVSLFEVQRGVGNWKMFVDNFSDEMGGDEGGVGIISL